MLKKLSGLTLLQLGEITRRLSLPGFTASQIAGWLYGSKVSSIEAMTNLSKAARAALSSEYEVGWNPPCDKVCSGDGTVKYLFEVQCSVPSRGRASAATETTAVEAVMIPDGDRKTLCISSQAGCRMGCKFCMTGRQGWHGNLDAAQILSQIVCIPECDSITNVVFMGMGEPLDNYETLSGVLECLTSPWGFGWSPKRVTVSTSGLIPPLKRLLDEHKCHVALSLHNPFPEQRESMMPVQRAFPARQIVSLLRKYDFSGQRRVSFEYTAFAGWNDSKAHSEALIRLLKGLECRVNLIRFHRIPDFPYESSSDAAMERFRKWLEDGGVTATIRASRGEDIAAACGLLAGRHDGAGAASRSQGPAVSPVFSGGRPAVSRTTSVSAGRTPSSASRTAHSTDASVLDSLRRLCSMREYCPADIYAKAVKRLGSDAAADAVRTLTREGYLSESRYASAFARDRSALSGWGPVKIRAALRARSIPDEIISDALGGIDRAKADDRLHRALLSKSRQLGESPDKRVRLLKFALSRGYSYDEACKAVSSLSETGK